MRNCARLNAQEGVNEDGNGSRRKKRRGDGVDERRSVDRYSSGAADHLHGDHAADAERSGGAGAPAGAADSKNQNEQLEAKTIVVQVLENNKLKINEDDATWDTLGPRLNDIFKLRAEKVAFVKGDDTVVFAQVARAIDIMRSSGVDKVGLITAKLEAGQ